MTTQVLVLILPGEAPESRILNVQYLFSDPIFTTEILNISAPEDQAQLTKVKVENNKYITALKYSYDNRPNIPVILAKDSTISNADPTTIASKVRSVQNLTFDVFYLAKWVDQCQKYRTVNDYFDDKIVWTQSPFGVQCLYFSTEGREIILGMKQMKNGDYFSLGDKPLSVRLNEEIYNGNISALTTRPNLVDYDIALATSNSDYLKLNECKGVPSQGSAINKLGPYFWFILVVLIILAIGWAVIRLNGS